MGSWRDRGRKRRPSTSGLREPPAEARECRKGGEPGECREPEAEEAVREHAKEGGREGNADGDERERHGGIDAAYPSGGKGKEGGDVARGVAEDDGREGNVGPEGPQPSPQAGDVADPVEEGTRERGRVAAGVGGDHADEDDTSHGVG
jgi:hypothetical protein